MNKRRAILISSPTEVLLAEPGHTVLPEIEVKNATNWDWKHGITLSLDDDCEWKSLPIAQIYQPIDFPVTGQQTFKVCVVIQVNPNAEPSDKIYNFVVRFRGPKGKPFGDPIPLSLQVTRKVELNISIQTELQWTRLAIKLFDQKVGASYEECANAVRKANGDEALAIQLLKK